jgi:hypothetical protein
MTNTLLGTEITIEIEEKKLWQHHPSEEEERRKEVGFFQHKILFNNDFFL